MEIAREGFVAPFVHWAWSCTLTRLYSLRLDVPWYGLSLYALQAVSLSLVLTVFYRLISPKGVFGIFAAILLFFWADMFVRLDYTGTSMMAGAGPVLLFLGLHREGRANVQTAALVGLLLAVAALPRSGGIIAVMVTASPFLAFLCLLTARQSAQPAKAGARMALLLAILLSSGLLAYYANGACRSTLLTEDERRFEAFNRLRGRFHGFPVAAANLGNAEVYQATGWTEDDYRRLVNWMFFDERLYNTATLAAFHEHAFRPGGNGIDPARWRSSVYLVFRGYCQYVFLMGAGLALAWSRQTFRRCDFILLCLTAGSVLATAVAIEFFLRLPYQVGCPMLLSGCLFLCFFSTAPQCERQLNVETEQTENGRPRLPASRTAMRGWFVGRLACRRFALTCVLPTALILACFAHGIRLKNYYAAVDGDRRFMLALTGYIDVNHPGAFLVAEPGVTYFHLSDPINPPGYPFTRIPLGWSTFHPWFYRKLGSMGLQRGAELMPAMMSRDDILVLTSLPGMELLLQYSRQEGFGDPQVERLAVWGGVILYRLREAPAPPS